MVQNGIFWTIGEQSYFVYYPIISYRKIKVYSLETMYMGISHWNNGVSGTIPLEPLVSVANVGKYYGNYCTIYDTFVRFLL